MVGAPLTSHTRIRYVPVPLDLRLTLISDAPVGSLVATGHQKDRVEVKSDGRRSQSGALRISDAIKDRLN